MRKRLRSKYLEFFFNNRFYGYKNLYLKFNLGRIWLFSPLNIVSARSFCRDNRDYYMIKPIIMPIKRIPNFLSDNPHVLLRPLAGICHVRWYGYTTIANYFAICPETALCGEIEILILIFSLRVPSSYSYTASYIAMIIYFIGDVLHIV